ncbi:hypothetical protein GCM10011320_30710 [Neoroseomonas lacus]|uniref:Uncharacterized protein n=1 Tax=Neoroseomonas lacus TaxID=287609 RepID=A0A917NRF0_9PROT|nr:hypothetical protein GCM10011320_30710 [Neoroseomonas lacus]
MRAGRTIPDWRTDRDPAIGQRGLRGWLRPRRGLRCSDRPDGVFGWRRGRTIDHPWFGLAIDDAWQGRFRRLHGGGAAEGQQGEQRGGRAIATGHGVGPMLEQIAIRRNHQIE